MIRSLRAFFLVRPFREKVLLCGFLILLAAFWLSGLARRAEAFVQESAQTSRELKEQALWLSNQPKIQREAAAAAASFDAGKTLDSNQLLAAVNQMAQDAGLTNTGSSGSQDNSVGQFAYHTLQFTLSRDKWVNDDGSGGLKAFYRALEARAPYIGVEQLQIQADRSNPSLLNVSLKISSVEVVHGAAQ